MKEILFPYGKTKLAYTFGEELMGVLTTEQEDYVPKGSPAELVEAALQNPIGTLPLKELAKGKKNIVIIASDHTRPVPSKVILPPMLREIRAGSPDAKITILIATGCHRLPPGDHRAGTGGQIRRGICGEGAHLHPRLRPA